MVHVSEPVPPPGKALVKVDACGICGTDLHLMDGLSFTPSLPFIPGHELVGTVVAVGASADERWLGSRVTATIFEGCGICDECRSGDERLCTSMVGVLGLFATSGAYAEYAVVPTRHLIPVPASLSSVRVACVVDAGPTARNALRVIEGRLHSGGIVVVGAGPVGFLVAQLLGRTAVDPLIVEPNDLRRSAVANGRRRVARGLDEVEDRPNVVIECSGAEEVVRWAVGALRPHGTLVAIGFPTLSQLSFLPVVRKELRIIGVRSGTTADLVEILDLAADGRLALPQITEWGLDGINDALEVLRSGGAPGKCVIVTQSQVTSSPSQRDSV